MSYQQSDLNRQRSIVFSPKEKSQSNIQQVRRGVDFDEYVSSYLKKRKKFEESEMTKAAISDGFKLKYSFKLRKDLNFGYICGDDESDAFNMSDKRKRLTKSPLLMLIIFVLSLFVFMTQIEQYLVNFSDLGYSHIFFLGYLFCLSLGMAISLFGILPSESMDILPVEYDDVAQGKDTDYFKQDQGNNDSNISQSEEETSTDNLNPVPAANRRPHYRQCLRNKFQTNSVLSPPDCHILKSYYDLILYVKIFKYLLFTAFFFLVLTCAKNGFDIYDKATDFSLSSLNSSWFFTVFTFFLLFVFMIGFINYLRSGIKSRLIGYTANDINGDEENSIDAIVVVGLYNYPGAKKFETKSKFRSDEEFIAQLVYCKADTPYKIPPISVNNLFGFSVFSSSELQELLLELHSTFSENHVVPFRCQIKDSHYQSYLLIIVNFLILFVAIFDFFGVNSSCPITMFNMIRLFLQVSGALFGLLGTIPYISSYRYVETIYREGVLAERQISLEKQRMNEIFSKIFHKFMYYQEKFQDLNHQNLNLLHFPSALSKQVNEQKQLFTEFLVKHILHYFFFNVSADGTDDRMKFKCVDDLYNNIKSNMLDIMNDEVEIHIFDLLHECLFFYEDVRFMKDNVKRTEFISDFVDDMYLLLYTEGYNVEIQQFIKEKMAIDSPIQLVKDIVSLYVTNDGTDLTIEEFITKMSQTKKGDLNSVNHFKIDVLDEIKSCLADMEELSLAELQLIRSRLIDNIGSVDNDEDTYLGNVLSHMFTDLLFHYQGKLDALITIDNVLHLADRYLIPDGLDENGCVRIELMRMTEEMNDEEKENLRDFFFRLYDKNKIFNTYFAKCPLMLRSLRNYLEFFSLLKSDHSFTLLNRIEYMDMFYDTFSKYLKHQGLLHLKSENLDSANENIFELDDLLSQLGNRFNEVNELERYLRMILRFYEYGQIESIHNETHELNELIGKYEEGIVPQINIYNKNEMLKVILGEIFQGYERTYSDDNIYQQDLKSMREFADKLLSYEEMSPEFKKYYEKALQDLLKTKEFQKDLIKAKKKDPSFNLSEHDLIFMYKCPETNLHMLGEKLFVEELNSSVRHTVADYRISNIYGQKLDKVRHWVSIERTNQVLYSAEDKATHKIIYEDNDLETLKEYEKYLVDTWNCNILDKYSRDLCLSTLIRDFEKQKYIFEEQRTTVKFLDKEWEKAILNKEQRVLLFRSAFILTFFLVMITLLLSLSSLDSGDAQCLSDVRYYKIDNILQLIYLIIQAVALIFFVPSYNCLSPDLENESNFDNFKARKHDQDYELMNSTYKILFGISYFDQPHLVNTIHSIKQSQSFASVFFLFIKGFTGLLPFVFTSFFLNMDLGLYMSFGTIIRGIATLLYIVSFILGIVLTDKTAYVITMTITFISEFVGTLFLVKSQDTYLNPSSIYLTSEQYGENFQTISRAYFYIVLLMYILSWIVAISNSFNNNLYGVTISFIEKINKDVLEKKEEEVKEKKNEFDVDNVQNSVDNMLDSFTNANKKDVVVESDSIEQIQPISAFDGMLTAIYQSVLDSQRSAQLSNLERMISLMDRMSEEQLEKWELTDVVAYRPKQVSLSVDQANRNADTDDFSLENRQINVPLMSMVSNKNLVVDEVELDLQMALSSGRYQKTKEGEESYSLGVDIQNSSQYEGKDSRSTKIHIGFKAQEPSEGLARLEQKLVAKVSD
eukprot:TRINITY_DN3275_c0_g1_i1.p1 TRINITY_DN3275_c0_g1~~TRINITY_DN3275_c0_g1_i1.p1  ORF type:complete len:1705 (+),score=451.92 TRINITY_DN3275_c0_g1_i1:32-5116(+)